MEINTNTMFASMNIGQSYVFNDITLMSSYDDDVHLDNEFLMIPTEFLAKITTSRGVVTLENQKDWDLAILIESMMDTPGGYVSEPHVGVNFQDSTLEFRNIPYVVGFVQTQQGHAPVVDDGVNGVERILINRQTIERMMHYQHGVEIISPYRCSVGAELFDMLRKRETVIGGDDVIFEDYLHLQKFLPTDSHKGGVLLYGQYVPAR